MSLIDRSALPRMTEAFMDLDHDEFIDLLDELKALLERYAAGEPVAEAIDGQLDRLVDHSRRHFAAEEAAMREHHFLPYPVHKRDHDEALARMETAAREWRRHRNLGELRMTMLVQLPGWFFQHVSAMDLVTARFLAQQRQAACSDE